MKREGCTHDVEQMTGLFAGPIGECRCCGFHFGYLDSYSSLALDADRLSVGGYEELKTSDPTLCEPCGGRPTIVRTWHGTAEV